MNTAVTDLIRVHVDIIVLKTLEQEDRYGLEILSAVSESSASKYEIKQPTLYNILKRLEKQGLIESYEGDESLGAKRKYFKLTTEGNKYLNSYQDDWVYTRTLLDNLISSEQIDLETYVPPFDASALRPMTRREKAEEPEQAQETAAEQQPTPPKEIVSPKKKEREPLFVTQPYLASTPHNNAVLEDGKENRDKASRMLGIGKYAPKPGYKITDDSIKNPAAKSKNTIYHKIFTDSMERFHEKPKIINLRPKAMHFNDLAVAYKNQGIELESYSSIDRLAFYKNNFIKINKIKLIATILTFLIVLVELSILYFYNRNFNLPIYAYPIVALLAFPYFQIIRYAINPNARQLLNYNFYISVLSSLIIFLLCISLTSILFIVSADWGVTFTDPLFYAPWLLFSNLVIYQLIYRQLFVSKKYHCKSVL